MTRPQATPCSSQLIWAEGRIAELEEELEDLTAKLTECEKDRDAWEYACLDWENEAIAGFEASRIPQDEDAF